MVETVYVVAEYNNVVETVRYVVAGHNNVVETVRYVLAEWTQ